MTQYDADGYEKQRHKKHASEPENATDFQLTVACALADKRVECRIESHDDGHADHVYGHIAEADARHHGRVVQLSNQGEVD